MKKIVALGFAGALAVGSVGATAATAIDSHVAWCEQHYQSYNPATDTYNGNDDNPHRCLSPYSASGETRTFSSIIPNVVAPSQAPSGRAVSPPGTGTTFRVYPGDDQNNGTPNF